MTASKFSLIIFIILVLGSLCTAQTIYNYTGSKKDITLTTNLNSQYTFKVRGGDGGWARVQTCEAGGGNGAITEFTITVGNGEGQIPPGTLVRLIVGGKGENDESDEPNVGVRGSGGGGSAVLAKIGNEWVILGVAGGGGGAYRGRALGFCVDYHPGEQGRTSTSGGDGNGTYGGDAGTNGNGGTGGGDATFGWTDFAGGGGGAFSDGSGSNNLDGSDDLMGGKKGLNQGGAGGNYNNKTGGWGFGGGGCADQGGGGGGGYSGGGGGSELSNGGGGGSYVNDDYTTNTSINSYGHDTDTQHGYIELYTDCEIAVTGFEYINPLCTSADQGRIQFNYTQGGAEACTEVLRWTLEPLNGWNYLGDGVFRSMRAGDYTLIIENTDFDEIKVSYDFNITPNGIEPEARCKNVSITLEDGIYDNPNFANLINNGSTSFCDEPLTLSASTTSFDCTDDIQLVLLTVTGHNGASDICSSTVTVISPEEESSVANCKPSFDVELENGIATLSVTDIDDNSALSLCWLDHTISPTQVSCSDVGSLDVTMTIEDFNGHQSQCITTINVVDAGQPTANCQATYELLLQGDGTATLNPADLDNGSLSNNCTNLTFSTDIVSFNCDDIGGTTVTTLTATDGHHRNSTCQTTVNVVEIASPIARCKDITVGLDDNGNYALDPTELDDGSNAGCTTSLSSSVTNFNCDDLGEQFLTLTVSSAFNQQATCEATVTVVDTIPPNAGCLDFNLTVDSRTSLNPFRTQLFQQSSDNCDIKNFEFLDDIYFECSDAGVHPVRLEITDNSDNRDTCTITVTITASDRPVTAYCRSDPYSVELDDDGQYLLTMDDLSYLLAPSSGLYCNAIEDLSLTVSQSVFTCGSLGNPISITLGLTEPGNAPTSCAANIQVVDEVDPVCDAAKVAIKAILQGTYDSNTVLMRDDLRTLNLLPTISPYAGTGAKTTDGVLAVTGPDAIVDWVLIELRDEQDQSQVLYTKAALLQRNGDVVDVDGVSYVTLPGAPVGDYYVAIKHRNHLATMTSSSIYLD